MSEGSAESGKGNITKSREEWLVHVKPTRVCELALIRVKLLPSHRGWETGPVFRCWLAQTVNSFDNLEFSQVGTLRGARVIQGMQT